MSRGGEGTLPGLREGLTRVPARGALSAAPLTNCAPRPWSPGAFYAPPGTGRSRRSPPGPQFSPRCALCAPLRPSSAPFPVHSSPRVLLSGGLPGWAEGGRGLWFSTLGCGGEPWVLCPFKGKEETEAAGGPEAPPPPPWAEIRAGGPAPPPRKAPSQPLGSGCGSAAGPQLGCEPGAHTVGARKTAQASPCNLRL